MATTTNHITHHRAEEGPSLWVLSYRCVRPDGRSSTEHRVFASLAERDRVADELARYDEEIGAPGFRAVCLWQQRTDLCGCGGLLPQLWAHSAWTDELRLTGHLPRPEAIGPEGYEVEGARR